MFRSKQVRALVLAGAMVAAAGAAWAQLRPIDAGPVMDTVASLRAGEYIWAPELAPEGPILVVVNRATQKLVAYRNGIPFAVSTVSTGKPGHRTPLGVFNVLQKRVRHFSNLYDNAPMPFMQRLTWQGVAIHGGDLSGYPASHGCIRLPHAFAKLLFAETHLGMTVVIVDQPAQLRLGPMPEALQYPAPSAQAGTWWEPWRAPAGPVSIVVSGADRRMTVLRNGVAIGSAPVAFDGAIDRVQAWVLEDAATYRWRKVTLPGTARGSAPVEGVAMEGARFGPGDPFREALASVVAPGTTLVAIPDSLGPAAPRAPMLAAAHVIAQWRRDPTLSRGR